MDLLDSGASPWLPWQRCQAASGSPAGTCLCEHIAWPQFASTSKQQGSTRFAAPLRLAVLAQILLSAKFRIDLHHLMHRFLGAALWHGAQECCQRLGPRVLGKGRVSGPTQGKRCVRNAANGEETCGLLAWGWKIGLLCSLKKVVFKDFFDVVVVKTILDFLKAPAPQGDHHIIRRPQK